MARSVGFCSNIAEAGGVETTTANSTSSNTLKIKKKNTEKNRSQQNNRSIVVRPFLLVHALHPSKSRCTAVNHLGFQEFRRKADGWLRFSPMKYGRFSKVKELNRFLFSFLFTLLA
jgi:hypothetical protein